MKKVLLILTVLLVFSLGGCSDNTASNIPGSDECIVNIEDDILTYTCDEVKYTGNEYRALIDYENIYYTQEEVDEEIRQEIHDYQFTGYWLEECFDDYICACKLTQVNTLCTVLANNNAWNDELEELRKRIEELEKLLEEEK